MNTALLLSSLYNNFINNKIDSSNDTSFNNTSSNDIPANNIKSIDIILENINLKCKKIVDDLINDRDNFENNNFKYIGNTDYFTNESRKEYRDHNRYFKDFLTDVVNQQIISFNGSYNFMYIIWKIHICVLDYYRYINNIKENDIIFLFKGGDYLSKLAKTFWTSLPSHAVRYLTSEYEKYFKKSDLDYTIYINPNLDNYDVIYKDINYLAFKIQYIIRDLLLNNKYIIFHWFKYNTNFKSYILNEYLNKMIDEDNVTNDPENTEYYKNKILNLFFDNICAFSENTTYYMRNDQVVKYDESKNIIRRDIYTKNKGHAYITFNEALEFITDDVIVKFNLIRTKINFNIKFEKDGKTRYEHMGGEFIDVSIPYKTDSNIPHFFDDYDSHVHTVLYKAPCTRTNYIIFANPEAKFAQKTYTLNYIFYDLHKILFINTYYPWEDKKYEKRLYRLFYLAHIDFFSSNVIINQNQINIKKKKFTAINDYISQYKSLIYENQDSIYNYFKENKNNKKMCYNIINKLSVLLRKKEQILDYNDYENKLIIKIIRAVIKVITKSLYNYDLINYEIYDIKNINFDKCNKNESILQNLEKLNIFIKLSTNNLDIILGVISKIEDFCKHKTIDGNILNEYRFPTY